MGSSATTLVAGGIVVPRSDQGSVIHDGAVAIRGNRIAEVGPSSVVVRRYPQAEVIDASGKLVMPGLINCHTHLYSNLARGIATSIEPSRNFVEVLDHLWWRLDKALTEEDIRCSAQVGALDLVRNGTTMVFDHHASPGAVAGSLISIARAVSDVGLRANLCYEVSDRDGPAIRAEGLAENERFAEWVSSSGGQRSVPDDEGETGSDPRSLLSASMGLHASFTLDDGTLESAAATAAELDVGCHLHVAEDKADVEDSLKRCGRRVVERLESFGVPGPKTIAAHCVHVDAAERSILKETETAVVHNPESNMNNAVGCADVPTFLAEGLVVGLGTDGFTASMFDEMRVANLIHRHEAGDPGAGGGLAARLCLANNPMIASRLIDDTVGQLVPGALADCIVVDYVPPTPIMERNFEGHLLFGLSGGMVETVIIDGRVVLDRREFTKVNEDEIKSESREVAARLWKRM